MSITRITKTIAIMLDDKGQEVAQKAFNPTEKTFSYKGGSYIIATDKASYTTSNRWYWNVENYYYTLGNPQPLLLTKHGVEPAISAKVLDAILEADFAKKISALSKGIKLNWKTILIGAVILVGIYFVLTKGIGIKTG